MSKEKIFAIGDIHGCAEELLKLIDKLPLESNDTLVFLGDYIDRGPNSKKVIDIILELRKSYNVITLKGNHESMIIDFLTDPSSASAGMFIVNGGSATLASYSKGDEHFYISDEHREFYYNLKLFHQTEDYYFVHAGVPDIPLVDLNPEYYEMQMLWIRSSFHKSTFKWSKTIVHGHTVTPEVEITPSRINLDTGCVYKGKLTAMELPSREVYSVQRNLEVPKTFLRGAVGHPRVATRFNGAIPVYINKRDGSPGHDLYETLNYNEFGMLLREVDGQDGCLFSDEVVQGLIGKDEAKQVGFVGEVVRTQEMKGDVYYGIKMIKTMAK